ncbi:MAG TPA: hypothetical protein DIV36_11440, partial [Verrucomicrobiales bacterium]|nr:hypothetical protein [Verrucomicrobiales bacterium]
NQAQGNKSLDGRPGNHPSLNSPKYCSKSSIANPSPHMSPEEILRMRSSFVALTASLRSNHEMAFGSGFWNDPFGSKPWRRIAASVEGDTTEHQGSVVRV